MYPTYQSQGYNPQYQYEQYDSGTDSDTVSSAGDMSYHDDDLHGLNPEQIDEQIFWAYQRAKSRWRRHMHKPTRRVRRFFRKPRRGKGKGYGSGKGKGAHRYSFLSQMSDYEVDQVFFGGKGKGGKRSSGKGKGRKRNPVGRDGNVMKCSICQSDTHFRAECPNGTGPGSGKGTFGGFVDSGPLSEVVMMVAGRTN
jgi:hypothetical protein